MIKKLEKKVFINGSIKAVTGISVGGGSVGLEIGGADKVVVRNPITKQPYIPGSSLKGKMRSLLEKLEGSVTLTGKKISRDKKVLAEDTFHSKGNVPKKLLVKEEENAELIIAEAKPCKCGTCLICQVFGVSAAEDKGTAARLIVRDSDMMKESVDMLKNSKSTDMLFTEVKTEVVIDRITSAATPRNFERVPAGAEFELNMVCNIYEGDEEGKLLGEVFKGLRLVQDDYLGGCGSRGYGQVKFSLNPLTCKNQECYENNKGAVPLEGIQIPKELL